MEDFDFLFADRDFNLLEPIQEGNSTRFAKINSDEIDKFLDEQENENTRRKTAYDLKLLYAFLSEQGEVKGIEEIEPPVFDTLLSKFLITVRKKDGSEYEPSSLRNFVSSFERHLKRNAYGYSLTTSEHFAKSRAVLKAKQKDLKSQGKGNKPRASDEVSDNDLDAMYKAGTLGLANRSSLIHSMWALCTLYFGMRTGKEVHQMKWGDVELRLDENGEEYLIFTSERQSKTRNGENVGDIRKKPRAYSIPDDPDRDPVACYKKYRDVRPSSMMEADSPFFLAINHCGKADSPWYKASPMGLNKLYSIMKDMKEGTTISEDKHITPYSMRKHLVQKLMDEGVATNQIMEITGHKNTNSISNYSHLKPEQQRKISHMLSNVQPTATTTSASPAATMSRVVHDVTGQWP